ncbi:MAG: ComEC/Rec2 family competence protein [Cyanobacteria bacterium P01_F01_bin.150]
MSGYVLFVGYIVGLLLVGLYPGWTLGSFTVFELPTVDVTIGMGLLCITGAIASFLCPRIWRMGPRPPVWLMAGLIGVGAGLYLQVRSPSYEHLLHNTAPIGQPAFPMDVGVQGDIIDAPQLTRSNAVRFTLHVTDIQAWQETLNTHENSNLQISANGSTTEKTAIDSEASTIAADALRRVTRKMYVTVPLLQGTGLKPGDRIVLHGQLNRPHANHIPGAFDFQQYLARQGIFTTLKAEAVAPSEAKISSSSALSTMWRRSTWKMRQRVVRSLVQGLDSPAGPLLSAMVLGRKAVDLPFDVRDEFIQAGLAHILAASGFHVSLLLGVILLTTRRFTAQHQLWIGSTTLLCYASLTGLQPSVCRAVLMGIAILVANTTERTVRPLGALLGIATALLLVEPAWIWDLGFQLSFLATVGLVVMVKPLVKRMEWLPMSIATAIAVPIAAMVWTLPILLRMMGTILPYSVILGVLLTPIIGLISLAGMVTGAIALMAPSVGSLLASVWYWPLHGLISVVEVCNRLPGQSLALGSIRPEQLVAIYSLYIAVVWTGQASSPISSNPSARQLSNRSGHRSAKAHSNPIGQGLIQSVIGRRSLRKGAILVVLMLVLIPLFYERYQKVQITVFPSSEIKSRPPFMLVQIRGHVGLINNGTDKALQYTLLPFLRHEGINQLDWAIATQPDSSSEELHQTQANVTLDSGFAFTKWEKLRQTIPIRRIYTLPVEDMARPNHEVTVGQSIPIGPDCFLSILSTSPAILELTIAQSHWLVMDHQLPLSSSTLTSLPLPPSNVWYWAGINLATHDHALQQLAKEQLPLDAIITPVLPPIEEAIQLANNDAAKLPQLSSIALYSPSRHHVVQWMPKTGFFISSEVIDQDL